MSSVGKNKKGGSLSGRKADKRKEDKPSTPNRIVKKKKKESTTPGTIELTIRATKGGFWLVQSEGYIHPLVKGIEEDDEELQDMNYYGKMYERRSFENDTPKTNTKGYWKYYILKQAEEGLPNTFESRMEHLEAVREYLQNHKDNIYNNVYVVNRDTADETPEELKALDHYIITSNIIEFVQTLHEIEGEDVTWARTNRIEKDWYFSGPTYPFHAKRVLGYSDVL